MYAHMHVSINPIAYLSDSYGIWHARVAQFCTTLLDCLFWSNTSILPTFRNNCVLIHMYTEFLVRNKERNPLQSTTCIFMYLHPSSSHSLQFWIVIAK